MKKEEKYILFKQNSELEMLISAAIVFVVVAVNDVIPQMIFNALNNNIPSNSEVIFVFASVALYLMALLPVSIILHFLFRIYWLSLVGLKSVFKENKESLSNYHPFFSKRIGRYQSLEKQIELVDKVSSSLFSFTLLSLFAFCFSFITIFILLLFLSQQGQIGQWLANIILFLGLFYAADFFSLGRLKRIDNKYFHWIYRPIYFFFSALTLSFLYRGIYYTLIHNVPKWLIGVLLPAYIVLALILLNLGYYPDGLFPDRYFNDQTVPMARIYNYENRFTTKIEVNAPFIESEVVPLGQNFITVKIPVSNALEDLILKQEGILPFNKQGLHWRKYLNTDFNRFDYPEGFSRSENLNKILRFMEENTTINIDDSTYQDLSFHVGTIDFPDRRVFISRLGIGHLEQGDHVLSIYLPEGGGGLHHIPFFRDR